MSSVLKSDFGLFVNNMNNMWDDMDETTVLVTVRTWNGFTSCM
jgi:hypothetical protein